MKAKALICLASFFTTNLVMAQPTEKGSIGQQLQAYYEKGTVPPWPDAIKELVAEKPEKRGAAAKYLVSLLDRAQADELLGKAPWRATPFWGSSGENPARNLRQHIADELAKAQTSSESLTVIRWYLDFEKVARFQEVAVAALDKIQGKEVDEFCLRLLQPAHENSVVVLAALKQIDKRKSAVPDDVLKGLCDHYRPSIRDTARQLNKDRGNADPGAFDHVAAMQRPALAALMTNIGALLDQPASPDAPFVKVTTTWSRGMESQTWTTLGWLVKDEGDSWVVSTPFGHRETFQKEKKTNGRRDVETLVKSSWAKTPIAAEVKRVVELRKKGDPDFALSERGGLTGQFQGRGAGVYEVTLAHWLYTAKQFELSAQLFLPALDSLYMDKHLVDMIRHRVGEAAGYRMLVSFASDRDFAETQRLAVAIVQRYPGTRFHDYAVKLSKEMPKRQDDFKKLKLPTPEEWSALKKKLGRGEQITYLAERIRLLNCFQWGQPGGYSITEEQYAEPSGMARNASWGLGGGTTKVINPYVELVGGSEGIFFSDDEKKPFKGMELTVADISLLAPFLRDDWHILCVSFWRDFAADRHLETTRPLFGSIIDGLAKRDLCQTRAMAKMSDAEIDQHIQGISRWTKANANKSEADLLWEPLDEVVKSGGYFNDLPNVARLVELKDKRLEPVLMKYLNEFETKGRRPNPNAFRFEGMPSDAENALEDMLRYCLRYNPAAFKEWARKHAKHKLDHIRLLCGYILFEGGEVADGRKVLADILENVSPSQLEGNSIPELIKALLKEGSPESKQTARLIFKNKRYADIRDGWVRATLVNRCAEAGIGDGYLSYLPLLDIKGPSIGGISYAQGTVVGELIAKEIVTLLAPKDPEIVRITKMFPKAGDQIAPLKEWLKAKAKAVEKQADK